MNTRHRSETSVDPATGTLPGDGFDDALTGQLPRQPEVGMSSRGSFNGLRVLLVDDHDDMLVMMNLYMSRRNYAVATANSGHQALELVETFAPHIVVSDIAMPGMDGYEMMSALRATDLGRSFKSIALSGYDMDDDRDKAHAAGYDAHLSKPIDFEVLFEIMDRLVRPDAQALERRESTD